MCNSATKLAVIVCGNGQWGQDINTMEDNDGGECDPTYINQRTKREVLLHYFPVLKMMRKQCNLTYIGIQ
jgi:hypothetical protein